MNENETPVQPKRTEEIQHIIDRMPTKFGYWITYLVLFIVSVLLIIGWFVKYHDVASGAITINTEYAPVKLIANSSGKIKLSHHTNDVINENEMVAYIQNPANVDDVAELSNLVNSFNADKDGELVSLKEVFLWKKYTLGELSTRYFHFLNALNLLVNYQQDEVYIKREQSLKKILVQYENKLRSVLVKDNYNKKNTSFYKKFSQRDSLLLSKKVISEAEFNRSELNYIASLAVNENSDYEHSGLIQEIENTNNSLQQLSIEKHQKGVQLKLELASAISELKDYIKIWEDKYLFKSPFKGKVQFLKFWVDNHFIHTGESIFTIVSNDDQSYGQVNLPIKGSGKVNIGQNVIIKLDNYPYMEYGSLTGKVKQISLTTNVENSSNGNQETYLINVALPNNLVTNYGRKLEKRHEIKGTAEIVTNERRLIQRIFDNLKYLLQNR